MILKGSLQPRWPCMEPRGPRCISPGSYGQIQEAALPNNPPHPTDIPFDLGPPFFQQMSSREDFMCRLLKKLVVIILLFLNNRKRVHSEQWSAQLYFSDSLAAKYQANKMLPCQISGQWYINMIGICWAGFQERHLLLMEGSGTSSSCSLSWQSGVLHMFPFLQL